VERWLRDQGKLAEVPLRERVWQALAGHPDGAAAALGPVGAVLLLVRDRPAQWRRLSDATDPQLAELLPPALAPVLTARLGEDHPVPVADPAGLRPFVPLLRQAVELAAETGPRETYEFLIGRHLDANPRQYTVTPPELAELMAALAGPAGPAGPAGESAGGAPTVLDPASGTGGLLWAVLRTHSVATLYAQELDRDLAALTALRLALTHEGQGTRVRVHGGDSLRADALPQLAADAVVSHPPFNERNWGHDELAYDPRWEYGFPARTESELAWVQHALTHLRDGGTAVLLMPPAVASRRSGRRIRADLLRRGALR
ncbi:class I SAM-dependent DNA methyltransferase, partial [Streptomyces sp. 2MCAF27]